MSSWRDNNEDDGLDDEVFDESDEFNDGLDDYAVSLGVQQRLQLVWLLMCAVICSVSEVLFGERAPPVPEQRLNWDNYVEKRNRRPEEFRRHLRMSLQSFNKLLGYIRHDLEVNELMASLRGGTIIPEICLFCTLRWLAGGSYLDIYAHVGISKASFYRVVWKTIKAICRCEHLALKFPSTEEECKKAARGFQSKSYQGIIANCVAAMDGFLLRIRTPMRREVGNVRSFFSGHYQCYGLNVQAVCDHMCRFLFFSVAAPGSTGDNDALHQTPLWNLIQNLPFGFVVIADAAYSATERICSIYYGVSRSNPLYDNFNYYASQCRIRIEMAFGLMTMKWGILARPLQLSVQQAGLLMHAIARLHNFVINERLETVDEAPDTLAYLPSHPQDENGDPIFLNDDGSMEPSRQGFAGWSEVRERMARKVEEHGLVRPLQNRLR
jgi:hypothetical protein